MLLVKVPTTVEPVPLAAMPVRFIVFVLVQLNTVPDTLFVLLALIVPIATPEQTV